MRSAREVALLLEQHGYYPIPLEYKTKRPTYKKWQDLRLRGDDLKYEFKDGRQYNIGVMLGLEAAPNSYLMAVDIDLDDDTLIGRIYIALSKQRMPAKRGQKGITFFVRALDQQRKKLYKRYEGEGKDKKLLGQVEVLGFGQQTVLPPSLHPDTHDNYEWLPDWGDPLEETAVQELPELTPWVLDEISLATEKPDSPFFNLNTMDWLGPSGGGSVHDSLLSAIGVMVQRKWPRDQISERCGRAVRFMLERCDYAAKWDWDVFNDVLSKMTEGAYTKGFDKGGPRGGKKTRIDMQNEAVDAAIIEFGGADRIGVVDGLFRVYSDGWWQEWTADSLIRRITQNPDNWAWITSADAKAIVSKVQYAATVKHRRTVDRIMTRSGALDLATGQLIGPDPEDLLTYVLPFEYDPEAKAPKYEKFMNDVFSFESCDPEDVKKSIRAFEEYAGLSFVVDTSFQRALVIQGPPASGKSTLLKLLEALHAPASRTSLDLFDLRSERTQVSLVGKLVSFTFEISPEEYVPADIFKQVADGSTLPVRLLYAEKFDAPMTARMTVACNEMFRYKDSSGAMERRMLLLHTRGTIPVAKRNRHLLNTLMAEAPGIFNKWMQGLRRLRKHGDFSIPSYMRHKLDEASEMADPVLRWLHERTHEGIKQVDPSHEVPEHKGTLSSELYLDFAQWSKDHGHKPMTDVTWGSRLALRGFPVKITRVGKMVGRTRALKLLSYSSKF